MTFLSNKEWTFTLNALLDTNPTLGLQYIYIYIYMLGATTLNRTFIRIVVLVIENFNDFFLLKFSDVFLFFLKTRTKNSKNKFLY